MDVRSMRCEEVRAVLPEYVGEAHDYPRPVQAHLATCTACALEESRYVGLLASVRGLRDGREAPPGFAERVLERLEPRIAVRGRARRLAHDPRTRYYAAAGLGGAVVGAAAIAVVLRRRRSAVRAA